jgi:tRNA splicing endonuclease
MAAKNIYSTLLGYDPYEQQLQQQKLWSGMYQGASSPYEKIGLALGQLGGVVGGKLFGNEEANPVNQINKLTTEASAQFTPNSAEYFKYIADNTQDPNVKRLATEEAVKAEVAQTKVMRENTTFYTANPQQATQALQVLAARIEANPNDVNALRQYESIAQAMQVGTLEDYNKAEKSDLEITSKKQNIQKTGLEIKKLRDELTPGERTKISNADLYKFNSDVRAEVSAPKDKLSTISELQTLLKDVEKNNNVQSYNLFTSSLAKAAGDNRVSEKEVARLTGGGSLITRGIGGLSIAFTGLPTDAKLAEIKSSLDLLEKETADKYNSKASSLRDIYKENVPDRIINKQLGQWETRAEKVARVANEKNVMGTKAFDAEQAKLPPRPSGIDPMTWRFMSEEQRKLFTR